MLKAILLSLSACGLTACSNLDLFQDQRHLSQKTPEHYHFEWQLSGHRAVAPLQVFDDGIKTWLQFAPGQPVPAIFAVTPNGDRLLEPKLLGPYQVLDGVWPQLKIRGGRQQSLVRRLDPFAVDTTSNIQP